MEQLIILGAGTFALEVTDLVHDIGGYKIVGYHVDRLGPVVVDDMLSPTDILKYFGKAQFIGAMVSVERISFIKKIQAIDFDPATIVHPSASISKTAIILPGTIINRQVAIGTHAGIGSHTIINRGTLIGHHVSIGPYSTIGPGANIAGRVRIGSQVTIGMGAIVLENITIGDKAVIGAGAIVTKDVRPGVMAIGNPAYEME